MGELALQYLQSAHNEVGHASRAWTGWVNALAPEYDAARDAHLQALKDVADETKLRTEQMWQILGFVLVGVGTPWAGRLLSKASRLLEATGIPSAASGLDALTTAFAKEAMEKMGGDAKDALKGSALDLLKSKASGSTTDPYTPTVEKTENWKSRLLESVEFRAADLEIAANEQVRNQHKWSVPAAKSYEQGMLRHCPFIAGKPSKPSDDDRAKFRKRSEFEMWVEWGLSLKEKWWKDKATSIDVWYMGPILRQLRDVGVPEYKVSTYAQRGTTIASMRRGYVLDLAKVVQWARDERWKRDVAPKLAEELGKSGIFKVKQKEHVCYPVGSSP
jgi:hypothetical protein